MAAQLQLQMHQISDLQAIRDLDPSLLQAVIQHLRQLQPRPMQPSRLREAIATVIPDHPEAADKLLRQGLSLSGLIRQRVLSVDEVLEGLRHALLASAAWNELELARWDRAAPSLRELLSLPAVRLVATALDLSYDYANLLQRARILTDIRPIFSEDATGIDGAVVSHTLRLQYDSRDGNHSLSIAMDENDIQSLAIQCSRALAKAQTAQTLMRDTAKVPTIISGGSADEAK